MVHSPAAKAHHARLYEIYSGWQLPAVLLVFDEACTLVFQFLWAGFLKGHFPVKKKSHVFSNLAIDQPYCQHNAVVKDDGGAVGHTECPAALKRWMFSGPEMARVIIDFER